MQLTKSQINVVKFWWRCREHLNITTKTSECDFGKNHLLPFSVRDQEMCFTYNYFRFTQKVLEGV